MVRANWYWLTIFCAALALSCWHSFGSEIRYISQPERDQLQQDFASAQPISEVYGQWICDMYGMSSHLQVSQSVHLYAFEHNKNSFENHGAQAKIVPVYKVTNGEMLGASGSGGLNDQLRLGKSGQLLSKLTHEGHVIAYSRCHRG